MGSENFLCLWWHSQNIVKAFFVFAVWFFQTINTIIHLLQITNEMNSLASRYSNAQVFSVGRSYEGRAMQAIKVLPLFIRFVFCPNLVSFVFILKEKIHNSLPPPPESNWKSHRTTLKVDFAREYKKCSCFVDLQ